jgi:hypothetical protein
VGFPSLLASTRANEREGEQMTALQARLVNGFDGGHTEQTHALGGKIAGQTF